MLLCLAVAASTSRAEALSPEQIGLHAATTGYVLSAQTVAEEVSGARGSSAPRLLALWEERNVSQSRSREEHAILEAIENGDLDKVAEFVESGVSPNDYVDGRMAPIHAAAAYNKVEILEYLLDAGADIELRDKLPQAWTPLLYANDSAEAISVLIDRGANVNCVTEHGYSVLHLAVGAEDENLEATKLLVEAGADVNATAPNGASVLLSAVEMGAYETAKYLLESGADPEIKNRLGVTVISGACIGGEERLVRLLLEHGVSLANADELQGYTPLHHAADEGHETIVRMLLKAGANASALTKSGEYPEDLAEEEGHMELAKLLAAHRRSH